MASTGIVNRVAIEALLEVFEDGVEAFAEAVVEFAQWGVGVDEEDGVAKWDMGL